MSNHKLIFTNIYNKNIWGKGSGKGSSYNYNKQYIEFLEKFIKNNLIKSIVDLGCGDWQFSKHINFNNINYLGVDCVDSVIQNNIKNFKNSTINFKCKDISNIDCIKEYITNCDLILIKDVLQHWEDISILKWLNQISIIKPKNLLVTNSYKHIRQPEKNKTDRDINNKYHYSPLDLTKKPFNAYNFKKVFKFKFKEVFLLNN